MICLACVSVGTESSRVVLESAADFSSPSWVSFLQTPPQGELPVFFAASPRMSNRDDEWGFCLQNAAVQASRFVAVQAVSTFLVNENNRDLFYLEDLDILYDRDLAEELVDKLVILREMQDRNGSYILASLDGYTMPTVPYSFSPVGGEPAWVKDFPSISGYYVGVGVAQRTGRFDTSVAAADDRALEEIIRQISVRQSTDRRDIEVDTVGTAFAQKRQEVSEAVVLGFYVFARWVSPDGANYYSLALCPRDKNTRKS